jgi:hypothetical protein
MLVPDVNDGSTTAWGISTDDPVVVVVSLLVVVVMLTVLPVLLTLMLMGVVLGCDAAISPVVTFVVVMTNGGSSIRHVLHLLLFTTFDY